MASRRGVERLLIVLSLFLAVTAVPSGMALILRPDGSALSMTPAMLDGTPFGSFLIPGMILAIVVGGSGVASAVMLLLRRPAAYPLAALCGAITIGWICGQLLLIRMYHPLQAIYALQGVVMLLLAGRRLPAGGGGTTQPSM